MSEEPRLSSPLPHEGLRREPHELRLHRGGAAPASRARYSRRGAAPGFVGSAIAAHGARAGPVDVLQDFICYLFPLVPGVEIAERNALNAFDTEEIDVALWNARVPKGLYFLPHLVLVECKNWSNPCGSQEVSYFVSRLRQRGCDHGILLAANGVTGVPEDLTRAHFEIATALAAGIRVVVVTPAEIGGLGSTEALVALLKRKLSQLVVSGTNFL